MRFLLHAQTVEHQRRGTVPTKPVGRCISELELRARLWSLRSFPDIEQPTLQPAVMNHLLRAFQAIALSLRCGWLHSLSAAPVHLIDEGACSHRSHQRRR